MRRTTIASDSAFYRYCLSHAIPVTRMSPHVFRLPLRFRSLLESEGKVSGKIEEWAGLCKVTLQRQTDTCPLWETSLLRAAAARGITVKRLDSKVGHSDEFAGFPDLGYHGWTIFHVAPNPYPLSPRVQDDGEGGAIVLCKNARKESASRIERRRKTLLYGFMQDLQRYEEAGDAEGVAWAKENIAHINSKHWVETNVLEQQRDAVQDKWLLEQNISEPKGAPYTFI